MTVVIEPTDVLDPGELADVGIHRDPSSADPAATGSWTQRLVNRASSWLAGRSTTRRSFLTRTAVVGSALAVGPIDFILKPGSAYGYVCGGCTDGWTAFCCSINAGRNSCPAGSFVAGWWKADNAAYCCGSARYILDCNATCPTQCSCRCTNGDSCDRRRTCCAQFRYGQCNQQIACYGPVVCRVATCVPPWQYDPRCTSASATDNRTRDHGANCLNESCSSPIDDKHAALGGNGGVLGAPTGAEGPIAGTQNRRRLYANGAIYWMPQRGAVAVFLGVWQEYSRRGAHTGEFGYPQFDPRISSDNRTRYANFDGGRIYAFFSGAPPVALPNPFFIKHESVGGVHGALGYPSEYPRTSNDGRSRYVNFERGRIYSYDNRVVEIHGSHFTFHESNGGVNGQLRYPATGHLSAAGGGSSQWFEGGILWSKSGTGTHALWNETLSRFLSNGNVGGYLQYPTSSTRPVGDGRGTFATFERGNIYATPAIGGHQVHGAVLSYYLGNGGPTGSLGYPTSELSPPGTAGGRFQVFEGGRLEYRGDGQVVPAPFRPFVTAALTDFLGSASSGAVDAGVTALNGGQSKTAFLQNLTTSDEWLGAVVDRFYEDTLGRPGDAGGRAHWVGELRSGRRTVAAVAALFYSSAEYYTRAGGTANAWVSDLYEKILGRSADASGRAYWVQQISTRGRAWVALQFYQSPESCRARVAALYQTLLGRSTDPSGLEFWAGRVRSQGDLVLATNLAASVEYEARARTRFP